MLSILEFLLQAIHSTVFPIYQLSIPCSIIQWTLSSTGSLSRDSPPCHNLFIPKSLHSKVSPFNGLYSFQKFSIPRDFHATSSPFGKFSISQTLHSTSSPFQQASFIMAAALSQSRPQWLPDESRVSCVDQHVVLVCGMWAIPPLIVC